MSREVGGMPSGRPAGPHRPPWRAARALVATVALLVAGTGCTALDDAMVAIFGRSMRDQRAFDPYENPVLPPENSVPFASGNYTAQLDDVGLGQSEPAVWVPPFAAADMAPPGSDVVRTLENPVPATDSSLARGQLMYDRYCAVCHGAQGLSAEAPILPKLPVMAAWNLATGASTGYSDGYVYGMIRIGRGAMPAYGHRIPHWDRWHIVNYVRRLQQQPGGGGAGAAGAAGAVADTAGAAGAAGGVADTAGAAGAPADTGGVAGAGGGG